MLEMPLGGEDRFSHNAPARAAGILHILDRLAIISTHTYPLLPPALHKHVDRPLEDRYYYILADNEQYPPRSKCPCKRPSQFRRHSVVTLFNTLRAFMLTKLRQNSAKTDFRAPTCPKHFSKTHPNLRG